MKYILLLLLIVSLGYSNLLEPIEYSDAISQAQEDEKIIMIMYGQDNCNACAMMDDKTFEDEELVDFINENFHFSYINITHSKKLRGLNVRGTPTFYFLNKDKKLLKQFVGSAKVKTMKKLLDDVLLEKDKYNI